VAWSARAAGWLFGTSIAVVLAAWVASQLWKMGPDRVQADPGISQALAAERARRIGSVSYDLALRIPAAQTEPVTGRMTAHVELKDASSPLVLDFRQPAGRLRTAAVNGKRIRPALHNGHVVIPASALAVGTTALSFEFEAGDEALNRGDDFLYSLFVPARASLAMPCFDQPDLKARWRVTLQVPPGWTAVSNGRETGRATSDHGVQVVFENTEPLPTYLMAVVAGRFDVEHGERHGRVMRVFHRETDRARITRNLDAILDQHALALSWLERYTGIPYAFGKFDIVLVPSFQFTGMEHPGVIYYNANTLLLDPAATQHQELARANVIAHETAHMWFGNLVTMRWFDDVWMKEVFANYFAARIANPMFPEMNHDLRFLLQHYPAAYEVDRTDGANPIRQPLANLDEAQTLYGAIIYQKAPIVVRQLERLVGTEAFDRAIREYLERFRFGNASWPDLVEIFDRSSPVDVARWSRSWVAEAGRPTISTELEASDGRIARLSLRQADRRERPMTWPQRLDVQIGWRTVSVHAEVTLASEHADVPDVAGLPTPDWVLPVGEGLGYGLFELDPTTLAFLRSSAHQIDDSLARGAAFVTLWDLMLEGRIPPTDLYDELLRSLSGEPEELNVQLLLDQARILFWRFTAPSDRARLAARTEPILFDGLARAATTSRRTAWFNALRAMAHREAAVAWLERVWRREERVRGLTLSETDEADLALDLAVRGVANANGILDQQLARFTNPDRRARFAFVMAAVSPDPVERDRFVERLRDPAGRRREAWAIDGLRYLHHPLRASTSAKHVLPALQMLEEIQRTGDIFFPKRWVDATLAGSQSGEMAEAVRAYINGLPPGYPQRLRWLLLASADPLFRAARLLAAN
jgi:aminopeptidase N